MESETIYMERTETRQQLIMELYQKVFPKAAVFVKQMGGTLEDTQDIFQDALVIYYEKTQDPSFQPQINEEAYLTGICKHLWYKKHRINNRLRRTGLTPDLALEDEAEPVVTDKLLLFLERAGKKCMELLRAFYYDQKPMREIADEFKFSGERSATVQKFKCLEKVRDTIREKSLNADDFYA